MIVTNCGDKVNLKLTYHDILMRLFLFRYIHIFYPQLCM